MTDSDDLRNEALQSLDQVLELFEFLRITDPTKAARVAAQMTTRTIAETHELLVVAIEDENLTLEDAETAIAKAAGSLFALARMLGIEVGHPHYPPKEKP